MKEIIVHCPTEQLRSKVFDKMKSEGRKVTIDKEDYRQECLCSLKEDDYEIYQGYISDFTKYNLPIIPAQEYLNQPFENKSASEQGIDTSRYFIYRDDLGGGVILWETLKTACKCSEDDGSNCPKFNGYCEFWKNLRYATQSEIDAVIGKKVEDIPDEELNAYPKIKTREDYSREITGIEVKEEVEEMTMEDVCKALGKTIKIKK
jgi:hypothetical protein